MGDIQVMPKHLQPKEAVKVADEEYQRYFIDALDRLNSVANGLDNPNVMSSMATDANPTLKRLVNGLEVINIQWKARQFKKFTESVDLWETIMRHYINSKLSKEEGRVL